SMLLAVNRSLSCIRRGYMIYTGWPCFETRTSHRPWTRGRAADRRCGLLADLITRHVRSDRGACRSPGAPDDVQPPIRAAITLRDATSRTSRLLLFPSTSVIPECKRIRKHPDT